MNQDHLKKIIELRHELHRHPETAHKEAQTMRIIKRFLKLNTPFQITECKGWMYIVIPGKDASKSIAFRADMDALPIPEDPVLSYASCNEGVSHRCGHDGHCAALCGLALELADAMPEFNVYLIFEPAEEIGAGAKLCVPLLKEKGISEIYAFHNLGGYDEGKVLLRRGLSQPASEGIRLEFQGIGAHAAAPEEGRNPAAAICETALFAESLPPQDRGMAMSTIVGISMGNEDYGLSPETGSVCVTLRAEEESFMHSMEEALLTFAKQKAEEQGLKLKWSISDYFPETRNHDACLEKVIAAAKSRGIFAEEMAQFWRASEDFGYYLKTCPGAIFYIGNGAEYPPLHSEAYDFNDTILNTAVEIFCALALMK